MSNAPNTLKAGFHAAEDYGTTQTFQVNTAGGAFTWDFQNFFHPYVAALIRKLNRESITGLLDASWHEQLTKEFFKDFYTDLSDAPDELVPHDKDIDVSVGGPYSGYNWELLFHVPLAIAVNLSKNQRFAEAREWFHYIFDPTRSDGEYWRFKAFREAEAVQIDDLLQLLSTDDDDLDADQLELKQQTLDGLQGIQDHPFQPHVVARTRVVAYMYNVVMKYLDNLIAWGDSLFLQDTIETINEATLCYVQASSLLGERPEEIPPAGTVRAKTFAELKEEGLDPFGNVIVDMEVDFPYGAPASAPAEPGASPASSLFGVVPTLYFCIPPNDKLLSYWDTVEDRLYKIRHCMNIEGVVRPLALFDPPLDPGMLVKAAAAGIDIGSIVSGLNAPPSPVRAAFLLQKAIELAGEVRALGGTLLSALEKRDGEKLALLRQKHEIQMQRLAQDVRFLQWKQAQQATVGLLKTRASAHERYTAYLRLLGKTPDKKLAPESLPLNRRPLTEENFDEAYAELVGQYDQKVPLQPFPKLKLAGDSDPKAGAGGSSTGSLYLSQAENADFNEFGPEAKDWQAAAFGVRTTASSLALIPDFPVDLHYWGIGSTISFGGTQMSRAANIAAEILDRQAAIANGHAADAAKQATFERRADDWRLQANLAARELMQNGRQVLGSLIAEQVARHEYHNAKKQIEHSEQVQTLMEEKFTNRELYHWMQGELSRLYYDYYRFAFDVARRAERTVKQELMRPELDKTDFLKFNYWDGGRKGLLAGDALAQDLKRLEIAYHDANKRELEITRNVSLRQLDPLALLTLRATGSCEVTIPEWLYDRDCPGHYMRRLKSVALSIPAVVGPYTGLHCTLSLLRSSVRVAPTPSDPYLRDLTGDDDRFADYFGAVQQVVTSSGTNDSGLFETNLKDERFLPFEGRGAISSWKLELPATLRPFDYATIADVILHVRYTARQGGADLGQKAIAEISDALGTPGTPRPGLLVSLRYEHATEWAAFANGTGDLQLEIGKDAFPYLVQSRELTIEALEVRVITGNTLQKAPVTADVDDLTSALAADGKFTLSIPAGTVLTRTATQPYLVVTYSY